MKPISYFLVIFILYAVGANAQLNFFVKGPRDISALAVIDSGNIRIQYALNKSEADPNISVDQHVLEIGKNMSRYYSYNIFQGDSVFTDFMKKNPQARSSPDPVGHNITRANRYFWGEYCKNYAKNMFTEYVYMPRGIPNYHYSEGIPDFAWQIHDDTLTVISYVCQKATCSFRGRNYIAWFCPDIPIDNGPWKFGGLPGLILSIHDDKNDYVFECIGIENNKSGFAVTSYDHTDYQKITREKLLKLWGGIFDNYFQLVGAVWESGSSPFKKISYNPLELE